MDNPECWALVQTPRLRQLRNELEDWERHGHGDPLAAYHARALVPYLDGLRRLAEARASRAESALLAALALGPRGALPGAGDLGPLLQAAEATSADAVDLAVAWGCGWHRQVVEEHQWHGRWVAAVLALSSMVRGAVNHTLKWLEGQVPGVREALHAPGPEERRERCGSYAQHIAMELAIGACRCSHGARGAVPGAPCGRSDHDLASWDPAARSLPAFLATAVRGSPFKRPSAGAFAVGMLTDLLRDDRLVRVEVAEFHVCHVCNAGQLSRAREGQGFGLDRLERGLYEFHRCRHCDAPVDPHRTYQLARKNWLIVPAEWGGQYEPVRRHRCSSCGNLFAAGDERCPLCLQPAGPRLTSAWVRRLGMDARRSTERDEAHGS